MRLDHIALVSAINYRFIAAEGLLCHNPQREFLALSRPDDTGTAAHLCRTGHVAAIPGRLHGLENPPTRNV